MNRRRYSAVVPYLYAVPIVFAAVVLRTAVDPLLENRQPFAIFFLAVVLAGRYCGLGPSLLVLGLSAPASRYFFMQPRGSLAINELPQQTSLGIFFVSGLFFAFLMWSEQRAKRTANQEASAAVQKHHELEREIAERKRVETELRAKESQLRGILDHTPAVVYLKDLQGRFVLVNRRFQTLFCQHGDSIIGKTDSEWFPESIAAAFIEADRKVLQQNTPLVIEEVALHGDLPHTYRSVKFPVKDDTGQVIALGGISTDITDLKEATDALNAKQELLRNLIDVQENEKRLLCHEFHDGLIQYAVGASLLMEGYRRKHTSMVDPEQIETAISKLRKGVEDGRRVIRGIRPAVLDDSNLEAAIHDLIEQFSNSEIMVTSKCDPEIGRLPESVQTTVYRVVQEALNNATKYSGTDVVRIELRKSDGDLHFEIRDFGCGFDVESARKQGFGLLGMTERVRLLGGECSILSEKDEGTTITARLPIPVTNFDLA